MTLVEVVDLPAAASGDFISAENPPSTARLLYRAISVRLEGKVGVMS